MLYGMPPETGRAGTAKAEHGEPVGRLWPASRSRWPLSRSPRRRVLSGRAAAGMDQRAFASRRVAMDTAARLVPEAAVNTSFMKSKPDKENEYMFANVERAAAEIEKYAAREVELIRQKQAKLAEAASAEESAGEALLDSENVSEHLDRVVRLQAEARMVEGGIRSCRARRLAAIEGKIAAEAAELRKRAKDARDDQERIASKTAKHLKALKELEGVEFVPATNPYIGAVPQSSRLASLTSSLENKAVELEQAGIPHNGAAEVDDARDSMPLVEAILRHPSDGPSATEILAWAAATDKDSRFGSLPRSYRVTWRDGVIDYAESFIVVPALAPQGPISIYSNQRLPAPMDSYTFRAPASMQPAPRTVKPVPAPEPPAAPPPEPPVPAGHLITVGAYLGHESRPRYEDEQEQPKEEAQA